MRIAFVVPVVILLAVNGAQAQPPGSSSGPVVSGRIVDADGRGIPYARIRVDGTTVAVRTTPDGDYTIPARAGATLVVTKAGYARTTRRADAAGAQIQLARGAVLAGRITDSLGDPVVFATVQATSVDGTQPPRAATTDDRGEFRIGSLPADGYLVSVAASLAASANAPAVGGFSQALGFRATTAATFFPGTADRSTAAALRLSAGEERRNVDIQVPVERLIPWSDEPIPIAAVEMRVVTTDAATVQGTVATTDGRPLARAQVMVLGAAMPPQGAGAAAPSLGLVRRTDLTDDQGHYQFSGLPAGAYTVRAAKAGYSVPASVLLSSSHLVRAGLVETIDVTLTPSPSSVVSGRLRDEFGDAVEGAHVVLLRARYERGRRRLSPLPGADRVTDDRGAFRITTMYTGEFIVAAMVDGSDAADLSGYARTFYPGTLALEELRTVTTRAGEIGGIDFALVAVATTRITGTVRDSAGLPTTKAQLTLIARGGVATESSSAIAEDGTFEFANVAPGQYVLQADAGRTTMFTEGEFVALPLSVGGADVLNLQVQMQPGSTITGRFVYDRFNRAVDPPPTAATIAAVPADVDLAPAGTAFTQANAEGVFQLRNVTGARRLQVTRVPPRYMVKAILVGGRDVTDDALTFGRRDQSLDDVEVVLTDRITQLTGTVTDANARPVEKAQVLIFSTDRQAWYAGSRFLRVVQTGSMGTFTTAGLPPGSYFVAVVPTLPPGDGAWQEPSFLDSLLATAIVTGINDGVNAPLALRSR